MTDATRLGRLLKLADVRRETSLSAPTIYRRIAAGTFPKQHRLSANRVAWVESEIEAWKRQTLLDLSG